MDKVRVYIPDAQEVWLPATLLSQEGTVVTVIKSEQHDSVELDLKPFEALLQRVNRIEGGTTTDTTDTTEEKKDNTTTTYQLPMLNEGKVGLVGDMTQLGFLGEPQILYNLRHRFQNSIPYTATGDVIVAVNPYVRIPELYGNELGVSYSQQARLIAKEGRVDNKLPPHVYTTAARAYSDMILQHSNQSVLVSGESGAGKTETTKIMINFLVGSNAATATTTSQSSSNSTNQANPTNPTNAANQATKILGANPLLESFGNAKTVRNDNSSRFGKYTTIQFANDGTHNVLGSYCTVYLLEKSRVVVQSSDERNYHFFYQILAGYTNMNDDASNQLSRLGLVSDPNAYRYLQNGQHVVDGMDDALLFKETVAALKLIGTSDEEVQKLIKIIASVLHLGNIIIADEGDDASGISDFLVASQDKNGTKQGRAKEASPLSHATSLLGIGSPAMVAALCSRLVVTPTENYNVPCKTQEALYRLEALSKDLYSKTFRWLVDCLNVHLASATPLECESISILDIFGFECFKHNTFEQLCINYANEKLQQRFTQDVLASVQLEYEREGIDWVTIDFEDNEPCLKMIEGRLGLLAIIEEETARSSTDQKMSNKLEKILMDNKYFHKPRLVRCGFEIKHYAGMVRYDANTFLAKNADALAVDLVGMMKASADPFVCRLYDPKLRANTGSNPLAASTGGGAVKKKRTRRRSSVMIDTVTSQFKRNLNQLMGQISSTNVNYIRCIKPNSLKSATAFDNKLVCDQLRYSGVVEAIEISRAAFPNRMPRTDVVKRFAMLAQQVASTLHLAHAQELENDAQMKAFVNQLFGQVGESPTTYVVGKTNVYFASGMLEQLESKRSDYMEVKAIVLQQHVRGFLKRHAYHRLLASIVLQKYARRRLRRKAYLFRKRGVEVLQTLWRRKVAFNKYRRIQLATLRCQCFLRAVRARQTVQLLRCNNAAQQIQTFYRGKVAWIAFVQYRKSIVLVQSLARAKRSTKHVRALLHERKEEAKLENQVAALKKQLAEAALASENNHETNAAAVAVENAATIRLVEKLKEENAHLRSDNDKLVVAKTELEAKVRELQSKLDNERSVTTATQSLRTRTVKKQRARSRGASYDQEMFDEMYGDGVGGGGGGGGGTVVGHGRAESKQTEGQKQTRRRRSSKERLKGMIDRGLAKVKTPRTRRSNNNNDNDNNGDAPPVPVSARRDVLSPLPGTPSGMMDSGGSNSNPRRRSWLRRMFSGSDGVGTTASSPSSSSPSARTPNKTPTSIALQRRSGRGWVCLKHDEWVMQRKQPFYIHLRLITGGYIGMNPKRVAERKIPVDGWSSNFVYVATPLTMPSKKDPSQDEKLIALRYSLSQTHLAPQSFFMGWSKKLGAHTDQSDRCKCLCFLALHV